MISEELIWELLRFAVIIVGSFLGFRVGWGTLKGKKKKGLKEKKDG